MLTFWNIISSISGDLLDIPALDFDQLRDYVAV